MTAQRLRAYRSTQRDLARLAESRLDPDTAELLRDMAEGLLLARDGELEEAEELETSAALALSLLAGTGRLTNPEADGIWTRISQCGPGQVTVRRTGIGNTGVPWPASGERSPSRSS